MSKINGGFLILVMVIFFSSIAYIWQADAEKRNLESQVSSQEKQIAYLEDKLNNPDSNSNDSNDGQVKGIDTSTGNIAGTISLSKNSQDEAILVCAEHIHTKQETCLDFMIQTNQNEYEYEFDIPQGTYEIYAMIPPSETKIYYSEISNCDSDGNCTSNAQKKRLIEVIKEETQSDINIDL